MSKKINFRRKLRFEGLEQRSMLAVTASLSGTELRVTGDNNPNDIDILQTGAGAFTVTSEEGPEGAFLGVSSIKVELKGDSDILDVIGNNTNPLAGNVEIKAGLGEDEVNFGVPTALDVAGNVNIETSDGDDDVRVGEGTNIGGNLTVNTGLQNDNLTVAGASGPPLGAGFITVGGKLTLKTSEGDDGNIAGVAGPTGGVNVGDIKVTGPTVIETSDGNDVVHVGGQSTFSGGFALNSGHGDDYVQVGNALEEIKVTGLLDLNTSVGNDILIVQLSNTVSGPTTVIRTSDGEDSVTIRKSLFASLDVNTGLDNDKLTFDLAFPTTVVGDATLNGSGGTDTLVAPAGSLLVGGTRTDKSFEL